MHTPTVGPRGIDGSDGFPHPGGRYLYGLRMGAAMVNIGIVGIGFMGMTHYRAARKVRGGRVRTICTRDPGKLRGDWRGIRGNFGEPGGMEDLSGVRREVRATV